MLASSNSALSFPGYVKQWTLFWEQFVIVHETNLPEITKFTDLKSVLRGKAKLLVQGMALTSDNYTMAMNILESRFGQTEQIITFHIEH